MADLTLHSVVDQFCENRSLWEQAEWLVRELSHEDELVARKEKLRNLVYYAGKVLPSRSSTCPPKPVQSGRLGKLVDNLAWVWPRVLAVFVCSPMDSEQRVDWLYENYSYYHEQDLKVAFLAVVLLLLRLETAWVRSPEVQTPEIKNP